jgi:hypothetical protein
MNLFFCLRGYWAIEALLATSLSKEVFPYREDYVVRVERSNSVKGTPELEIDQERDFSILRHKGNILTTGNTEENWVLETIALLISQVVTTPDELDGYLHRIFGEQLGLSRALNFTETSVPVSNIFGANSKRRLASPASCLPPRCRMISLRQLERCSIIDQRKHFA